MSEDISDMIKKINTLMDEGNIPDNMKNILNQVQNSSGNSQKENAKPNSENNSSTIDPEMISNLLSMLNNSSNSSSSNSSTDSSSSSPNIDFNTIMKMKTIIEKMNHQKDDPRANLLLSLKPYLKPSRKDKVEQYIKLFQMSRVMEVLKPTDSGGDEKK